MIEKMEFIYSEDKFVCHITEKNNIESIIKQGLLPLNGKRCSYINDKRIGVFCFDGLHNVRNWINVLYNSNELEALKILRFNLKMHKWYIDDSNDLALGMYIPYRISPDKISYLDIVNSDGMEIAITKLLDLDFIQRIDYSFYGEEEGKNISIDDCNLCWYPIQEYKNKVKKL